MQKQETKVESEEDLIGTNEKDFKKRKSIFQQESKVENSLHYCMLQESNSKKKIKKEEPQKKDNDSKEKNPENKLLKKTMNDLRKKNMNELLYFLQNNLYFKKMDYHSSWLQRKRDIIQVILDPSNKRFEKRNKGRL